MIAAHHLNHTPYAVICECGKRLGLHRVNDNVCPNPAWRCGNGHPQWLEPRTFRYSYQPEVARDSATNS